MEIAKDMKKDVLITIKGTQRVGGESDVIEMMTTGRFYRKNKLYYISYEETEATGYEGCRTTLKVGPNDKVTMTRFGPSRSQLTFFWQPACRSAVRAICGCGPFSQMQLRPVC